MIADGEAICLQEVSRLWAGKMFAFFQERDYDFIVSNYGHYRSDFMGVAIALPHDKYIVKKCEIKEISQTYPDSWPKSIRPGFTRRNVSALIAFVLNIVWFFLKFCINRPKPEYDFMKDSRRRTNTVIAVQLQSRANKNHQFCLATYHMPCAYWSNDTMLLHSSLAFAFVKSFADGLPRALIGDWNLGPDSPAYRLLTTSEAPDKNEFPGLMAKNKALWDAFELSKREPMVSAYAAFSKEPIYTNWTKEGDNEFCATLDYIFVSEDIKVTDVLDLPGKDDDKRKGPYPNKIEPSDHIDIGACLKIPAQSNK
eukprot:TRINITY_DN5059_c0_g1_i1.p1 TRINITY_DN5059_c0_g1~~TRINITY_DN5059_c0_g1_i1.p1  ORF type:complete len:311 (+),score=31.81 TRINITY_DN5059_c0_g1_i1:188-1120(+)